MTSHRRRKPLRPGRILLSLGAALGVVCLVAATASVFLDLRPMVVSSGSMSPAIPAGSLALAQDSAAEEVEVGDVVAVSRADGTRVMHRVVAAEPSGGEVALTLQGDANAAPDSEIYVVDRVLAVRFDVPWLGYPISWLSTTWGLMILGAGGFGLLVFALRPSRAPAAGRRRVAAFLAVPLAGVLVSVAAAPSSAFFTDTGTATSGSLASHTVLRPASASCSAALLVATVSWPGDARYDYEVVLRRVSNGSVVSTTQVTGTGTSVTYSGLASFGLVVGAGTVDFQVEITSYLAGSTSWRSADARVYTYIRVLAILIGATVSCTT